MVHGGGGAKKEGMPGGMSGKHKRKTPKLKTGGQELGLHTGTEQRLFGWGGHDKGRGKRQEAEKQIRMLSQWFKRRGRKK